MHMYDLVRLYLDIAVARSTSYVVMVLAPRFVLVVLCCTCGTSVHIRHNDSPCLGLTCKLYLQVY
jgi:hypothetical protein